MRKIFEILRQHHELHHSTREIGRSLNVSPGTVPNYLYRAKSAGISWPLSTDMSEEALYNLLFLPVEPSAKKRVLPDWEKVHAELRRKGVTLMLLWREYRDIHAEGVGSLGASQFTFVDVTESQTLPDWIGFHIRMWNYFGGVSSIVVPDNLKSGVSKAHRYDPDINANYQHVGEHYGFAIVPARAAQAKDKAKVENAVACVERQILAPLRHMTFTSIAEINAAIKSGLAAFNRKSFQKMKTTRLQLFETVDKPALKVLPEEPYQYAEWKLAKRLFIQAKKKSHSSPEVLAKRRQTRKIIIETMMDSSNNQGAVEIFQQDILNKQQKE